jgi:hypothetical protein
MKPFFAILALTLASCTAEPPAYITDSGDWNPSDYMWIASPFPETHRLQDHSFAIADKPIRIPEGRRRAQLPEKGAAYQGGQMRQPKGPPGMVKLRALRGKTETEAYVWINGLKAGKAPMFVHLPSGTHRFDVQTPSGEKKREEIEVKPKSTQHLVFRFPLLKE